jgi:hypothetical protein
MPRSSIAWLRPLAAMLLGAASLGASCGQDVVTLLPGVVNDPHNLSLRRSILAYGTKEMCREVQKRSVPLRIGGEGPAIGRFFVTTCFSQELESKNLLVQFGGYGYGWSNVTRRLGFDAGGAVEYEHDFQVQDGAMYVYFRPRATSAAQFTPRAIEQPLAGALASLPGGQATASSFGEAIMKSEIARGFTVIRRNDGAIEYAPGLLEKGREPDVPFKGRTAGRSILANERTEVHTGQRDYAGPFQVDEGQALYLTASIDGAPGVDVIVVPRGLGEQWLQAYTREAAPPAIPGPPVLDDALAAGLIYRRAVPAQKGEYYVVFDNTATAGRTPPAGSAIADRAALVSYAVEVGDAP